MPHLNRGFQGYVYESKAQREMLVAKGGDCRLMMKRFADSFPKFNADANPLDVFDVWDQGTLGSCLGHALAGVFSACYYLATRRKAAFSRACAYYISQRYDGIRGDLGATLSGGMKTATEHGLCLEKDWPYVARYNPTEPQGITYPYKLKTTKPMESVRDVVDWIELGLPVNIGAPWDTYADREVVERFAPGRNAGGHSTFFWLRDKGRVRNINSWGSDWSQDGMQSWTPEAIEQALRHPWTVMIGYAPDEMSFPEPEPVG